MQPSECEYVISKKLFCTASPVFAQMISDNSQESKEPIVTLQEIKGVISKPSVEAFIHWLYLRVLKFDVEGWTEKISAAIELARFGHKYDIAVIQHQVAAYIKKIITSDTIKRLAHEGGDDPNTYWLEEEHIIAGTSLPRHNPVRRLLAEASVHEFLARNYHKFDDVAQDYPSYGADLLQEVGLALTELLPAHTSFYVDPLTNKKTKLKLHERC